MHIDWDMGKTRESWNTEWAKSCTRLSKEEQSNWYLFQTAKRMKFSTPLPPKISVSSLVENNWGCCGWETAEEPGPAIRLSGAWGKRHRTKGALGEMASPNLEHSLWKAEKAFFRPLCTLQRMQCNFLFVWMENLPFYETVYSTQSWRT